jgi:hypothetical protein
MSLRASRSEAWQSSSPNASWTPTTCFAGLGVTLWLKKRDINKRKLIQVSRLFNLGIIDLANIRDTETGNKTGNKGTIRGKHVRRGVHCQGSD